MFIRCSVMFSAHTPSRHALGLVGLTSVSTTVTLPPPSFEITAALHFFPPPRTIEFLSVTLLPVMWT
jgi:hypothetical protein